jgi:hypothetical protein
MGLVCGESADASPLAPGTAAGRWKTPPPRAGSCSACGRDPRLIERMARETSRWGYMRIQGELLRLGINVSATTIASVLRASGLGPAPRRIGPSWSDFLRAQAHGMLGGGLSSAVGDDGLDGDARERSAPARDGESCEVEADGYLSPAPAAEPRLASQPLPVRSRSALPRLLPATRGPSRLRLSHRSHARDGPKEQAGALSHNRVLRRNVKANADRARVRANHASNHPREPPRIMSPAASTRPNNRHPKLRASELSFFTPQGANA